MTATYDFIASATTSGSPITLSSIPNTYADLRLIITTKSNAGYNCGLRFNNDSGTYQYRYTYSGAANATPSLQFAYTNGNYWDLSNSMTPSGADEYSCWTVDIFNYTGTTYKSAVSQQASTDFTGGGYAVFWHGCRWQSLTTIDRIDFLFPSGGGASSGKIALFGIKRA